MARSENQVDPEDVDAGDAEFVAGDAVGRRRQSPAVLPLLLGLLIFALNAYLFKRISVYLFAQSLPGALSFTLLATSTILSLWLIAYAFGLGRSERASASGVLLPLVLGGVAVAATVGGIQQNVITAERQTPRLCVDLIEQAQNIAKDNPRFRMPATDREEVRCGINAAIGR